MVFLRHPPVEARDYIRMGHIPPPTGRTALLSYSSVKQAFWRMLGPCDLDPTRQRPLGFRILAGFIGTR